MENNEPSVFVKTSQEGIDRVRKGNYAFFMESPMIDYTIQRNCEMQQVGGLLDSKGFGFATSKGKLIVYIDISIILWHPQPIVYVL